MLFLMLLFLMAQLHSFSRLALVFGDRADGPSLALSLALLLFGRPLGFVAMLGILALMGMIARNAVILIEQIETERARGAGKDGTRLSRRTLSRFRPIMLTAISTVLGFIPIAPTVFWGPMAFAIMGGLFVADDADADRTCRRSMSPGFASRSLRRSDQSERNSNDNNGLMPICSGTRFARHRT